MKWQTFGVNIFITLTYKNTNAACSDGATQQKGKERPKETESNSRRQAKAGGGREEEGGHPSCGYYLLLLLILLLVVAAS